MQVNQTMNTCRPTRNTRRRNVVFQGVPKYSPANIDALGLRRSPRISALHVKQLDPTLNHAGFAHTSHASEEDMYPLKEHCTFKEAMKNNHKEYFTSTMAQEKNNHTSREH